MAAQITVGMQFSTLSAMHEEIESYQRRNSVALYVRDSKAIKKEKSNSEVKRNKKKAMS